MTTSANLALSSDNDPARSANRLTTASVFAAALWALGLIVAAATVPLYQSATVGASTAGATANLPVTTTTAAATLTAVNGYRILALVGAPLGAVGVVATALWRRRQRGRPGPGPVASIAVGLLGIATLLAILSIGIVIVPVTALLATAIFNASGAPSPRTRWTPGAATWRSG
jgi:hypothetical protein